MEVTEINPMVAHAVGRLLGIVQVTQGHLVDHPLVVDPVVRVVPVDLAVPVDPVVLVVVAEVVVGAEAEAFLLVVLLQRPEGKWNTSLTLSALALVKHSRP